MKKSITVIIRWGLIISIIAGMKGNISSPQESMLLNDQWYLFDTETGSFIAGRATRLILIGEQQSSPVPNLFRKKGLKIHSRKAVKYHPSGNDIQRFVEGDMP